MPTYDDTELNEFRAAKDAFFRSHSQSPLAPAERQRFQGLRYYEPNPDLDLTLEPEDAPDSGIVEFDTSDGAQRHYLRWKRIRFTVDGNEAVLTLFRNPSDGSLFLPFQDANAGGDTYGAGRYLEPDELPGGRVHVDFNFAYNPFCAYNEAYSCPLPPAENRLRVAIEAGEKNFEH